MGKATVRKSEDRRKKQTEREGEDRRAGKDEDSTNLKKKEKRREEARYPKEDQEVVSNETYPFSMSPQNSSTIRLTVRA